MGTPAADERARTRLRPEAPSTDDPRACGDSVRRFGDNVRVPYLPTRYVMR